MVKLKFYSGGQNAVNTRYVLDGITIVKSRIDLGGLGVSCIIIGRFHGGSRGWVTNGDIVHMNLNSRSFHEDYRGYRYKTFGGIKDLTPGGVFAHELGHVLSTRHKGIRRVFSRIRKCRPKSCISGYGNGRCEEDIAETFRLYVTNPNALWEYDEERFNAIHKVAEQYMYDEWPGWLE